MYQQISEELFGKVQKIIEKDSRFQTGENNIRH